MRPSPHEDSRAIAHANNPVTDHRLDRAAKERAGASIRVLIDITTTSEWLQGITLAMNSPDPDHHGDDVHLGLVRGGYGRDIADASTSGTGPGELLKCIPLLRPEDDAVVVLRQQIRDAGWKPFTERDRVRNLSAGRAPPKDQS